ncbi:prepilin peptidase [Brevibacillus sp. SYP-B805]|uniref:prepilin peptidase n=1 Tax=Brevibacillus sp. SYP-B805 TaxID=1578199 RepID=UPI0013EA20B3|nr:A24 family peptidase [Brevibacillus sp. SYP-B805]NGQ96437.1 prepilin peptidase [Brevibacillus sp. SYP-B805]
MTQAAVFFLLGSAAFLDWKARRIPNLLVFSFMLAGFLWQLSRGQGIASLGGVGFAWAITFLPVLMNGMGMGDQKLLMAFGAWTSWGEVYEAVVWSLLSCLVVLACSPQTWRRLADNMVRLAAGWIAHHTLWFPSRQESALSLPYAVHLLIGYGLITLSR